MTRKVKNIWQGLQRRSSLAILITVAVLIETTSVVQYLFAYRGTKQVVEQYAMSELKTKNMEIQREVRSVEEAVSYVTYALERNLNNPEAIYTLERALLERNHAISGCAVAFKEGYIKGDRWNELFVGRDEGGALVQRQIGDENHNYFELDWYKETIEADGGHWTDPYIDNAGSKAEVCSYTMPLRDKNGDVVAVFCTDMSLDWLMEIFKTQSEASSTFLLSSTGVIIAMTNNVFENIEAVQDAVSNANDSMIDKVTRAMLSGDTGRAKINKSQVFYGPVEGGTGWSLAVVFADDVVYDRLNKLSINLAIFMLLGLGLLAFIMFRTVRGFRKLQVVNAEKERIGNELAIASGIQKGMLPCTFPPYPDRDEITMYGSLVPAKEVGGDLYDFYIRDEKLFFCIGDVSGKGVPASLVMAVTRSLFRTVSTHIDKPELIMKQINDAMSEMNESSMFVTLFIGMLDLHSGILSYSNAGHCPPYLVTAPNCDPIPLEMDANIPVGLMKDWSYTAQSTAIRPGNVVFLYTDGLTEAENTSHELYGEERLMKCIAGCADITPHALIAHITDAVHAFVGDAEQSDDLTMLGVLFNKYLTISGNTLHLNNNVQHVPHLANFIDSVAEANGIDPATTMSLNLAMEEAVVNVIKYAYPDGVIGDIDVTATVEDGTITFTIEDSGVAFDPTAKADPDLTLAAEDRPIGGLGIHLVRQLMDSIGYERRGDKNILTLTKKYNQQ